MEDVHAGHALQGLMDPTVSWGTLGTHLAAAKGARGARAEGFSSSSLRCYYYRRVPGYAVLPGFTGLTFCQTIPGLTWLPLNRG